MAWQVNLTRSPSRTERGSMDKMTVGGSGEKVRCQQGPFLWKHSILAQQSICKTVQMIILYFYIGILLAVSNFATTSQ